MLATPRPAQSRRLVQLVPLPAPDFLLRFKRRLHDRRFWIVQAMIGAVTASHVIGEAVESASGLSLGAAYFIPASLSFFPILYASLNFGREGAIPTAIWSALLAMPNIIIWHSGVERAGEAFQVSLMIVMAGVVAGKVDREIAARRHAQELEQGLRASEIKYRALFDAAAEPCLVVESTGTIREANAAAADFLGQSIDQLKRSTVANILGPRGSDLLKLASRGPGVTTEIDFRGPDGRNIRVQPICTRVFAGEGDMLVQALLRDVTEDRNLHDFAQQVVRAQEDERQRIAQELQDEFVQLMVALCWQLDGVRQTVPEGLPEAVTAELAEARKVARGIMDELSRFARDLRPFVLDDLGLAPAVRGMVEEISERAHLRGRLLIDGAPRGLPPSVEVSLFRIAQEALRNVERHASATALTVRLKYGRDVRLVITDNGKGFELAPYSTLASAGRLGLLGMHGRARLLGGSCRIESNPGKGTGVEIRIPPQKTNRVPMASTTRPK